MARVRKGDLVAVMSGDDKGRRGRVLRVLIGSGRVVVEGINLVHKHLRKSQQSPQGGRIRREAPIQACTVMPIDPSTDKPSRIASAVVDGRRARVARGSRTVIAAQASSKASKGAGADKPAPVGKKE